MKLDRPPRLHDQSRPNDDQNLAADLFVERVKFGARFGADCDWDNR